MPRRSFYRIVGSLSPSGVLLAGVVVSLIVGLMAYAAGVATTEYNGRQVGYWHAVNWMLNFTIFVPLTLYFIVSAFHSVDPALKRLANSGMLVDRDLAPYAEAKASAAIRERWSGILKRSEIWLVLLSSIGFVASLGEWLFYSALPLFKGEQELVPEDEIDWSVGALLKPEPTTWDPFLNGLVSFLAFSLQGGMIVGLLTFVFLAYAFTELMSKLPDLSKPRLVLNLRTDDPRRGFQVFEKLIEELLLAASFGFIVFYLSRLWNLYLASKASSLWSYAVEFILEGFKGGMPEGTARLFDTGRFGFSGSWVTLGALVLLVTCIAIPLFVLRRVALSARDTLEREISEGNPNALQGLTREEALARLRTLKVWPLGYPNANQLLVMAAFAFLSMFLVHIGLLYLGAATGLLVRRAFALLKEAQPGTGAGQSAANP